MNSFDAEALIRTIIEHRLREADHRRLARAYRRRPPRRSVIHLPHAHI